MKTAAIGIGSNSLRMLVADITHNQLHRLKRYREGLRTFAALDDAGNISEEMLFLTSEKVKEFFLEAKNLGAESVHLFATSAIRDAKNQLDLIKAIEASSGLQMEICSGKKEAQLSYVGAADLGTCGMIDIGGGSTELAFGKDLQLDRCDSLQLGAVRLYRKYPIADTSSTWKVVEAAKDILRPTIDAFQREKIEKWVGVGGTFTTCATVSQKIPHDDRRNVHGYVLSRQEVERIALELANMPLEDRLLLPSIQPHRADIVVHGIAILIACMDLIGIPEIRVSEYGNLEGYLKMKYLVPSF